MLVRCKSTMRDVPQPVQPMARLGGWRSDYWRSCMIERRGMRRAVFCSPRLLGGAGGVWLGFLFRFVCTSGAEAVFVCLQKGRSLSMRELTRLTEALELYAGVTMRVGHQGSDLGSMARLTRRWSLRAGSCCCW